MGFPRFVRSVPLGSVMPSSLRFLVGVLRRPEDLAEEAEDPRQLPGHSRGPPGGGGSLAVRSQRLLQPVQLRLAQHLLSPLLQDLQAHRSVHLRASSLLRCEILRSALTHLYRGSGWRGIGQKVDWGVEILVSGHLCFAPRPRVLDGCQVVVTISAAPWGQSHGVFLTNSRMTRASSW